MKSLIVDTATKNLYIALTDGNDVIEEYICKDSKEHSKNIMPEIERILNKNNINVKELERIYVGIGPGSYTGVRIGVTVCKMLAWTLNIPLYQVSSLYVMCSKYDDATPLIDARRGNAFCCVYHNGEAIISEELRAIDTFIPDKENIIDEDSFAPDPLKIMDKAKLVNPHACVPNYLRLTEAERNLHGCK